MKTYQFEKERAARRGTEIHDKLDKYFLDGSIDRVDERFIVPVIKKLEEVFPGVKWVSEESFCNKEMGYGGHREF